MTAIEPLARGSVLLVATDYDGTVAPIVDDPRRALPDREALVALRALAELPRTHVAIVSGRALRDLAAFTRMPESVHLVGSHGSEFDPGFATNLTVEALQLRERLRQELAQIAAANPGTMLEEKPASIALHYRNCDASAADGAVDCVERGPALLPGVHVKRGKKVIELGVIPADKASAIETLRRRLTPSATLFIGDDQTDEDVFARLRGPDLGIKVGDGPTAASLRLEKTIDVARLLAALVELRRAWLSGAEATPIERHSILSDQRTLAIVTPDARVDWLCLPRIDSSALLARLVGGPAAGYFSVAPADGSAPIGQRYESDTFVLHTRWREFEVIDYLDCSGGRPFQRAGRSDLLRVLQGKGRARIAFVPRLDFGRQTTGLQATQEGLQITGGPDVIVLRAPGVEWHVQADGAHQSATAEVVLNPGDPLVLELRFGIGSLRPSPLSEPQRREQTQRFWSSWTHSLRVPPLYPDLVRRSALVLKALVYGPTGALSAAATTSLPEHLGGVRNWDYRFCWPRDATLAAAALARLNSIGTGMRLLDWLLAILDHVDSPERLRPLYTVTGEHVPSEADISELAGYRGSRPVRVGNSAGQQVQLDVFGPIVELVALLADRGAALSGEHFRLVEAMVRAVEHRWQEPDHGIWEIRRPVQHHVHSKVMCWQTVDRAIRVADDYLGHVPTGWAELRETIAAEILARGWSEGRHMFTASYEEATPDAATLHVGLSGLLPPGDPRFIATVDAVNQLLRKQDLVYRYRWEDGLPGDEGTFNLCTAWLIESLALIGRPGEARALLDRYVSVFGPTGTGAEELDPQTGEALGNMPQAYTHLGLINAVLCVSPSAGRRGKFGLIEE